ncbi:MAG: phosphonopyruvate decarboxylase [Myxococcota bacterium]|nr:phosphonopyruvate decarboxylase [Myxococcota bacterium]
MILADTLLDALGHAGFGLIAGVPCSYLTPLINAASASQEVRYVGAANEGEAIAIACGAELAGLRSMAFFQNSGLGNAVNPLTSLAAPFRKPILIMTTWRGEPGEPPDEPQHAMMGDITPKLLELMGIGWERLPEDETDLAPALERADAHMSSSGLSYAFIVPKGGVGGDNPAPASEGLRAANPSALEPRDLLSGEPLEPDLALAAVQRAAGPEHAVLATTGFTGRALYALEDRPSQFYMVGSMGCISSVGLGIAKAQPQRRVIVLDGDGAMLMRLGAAATLGFERPPNLLHVLLDNGVHDSTGAQPTVSNVTDLAAVARSCGYPDVLRVSSAAELEDAIRTPRRELGFVHVRTAPRADRKLPRPTQTAQELADRFSRWLADD